MRIDILTLFPEMFEGPLSESILRQAREKGLLEIELTNIRDFARDKHRTADDYQYGGGSGMVMKPEPIFRALEAVRDRAAPAERSATILLSARGRLFDQRLAAEIAGMEHLILICGRYKGVDERVSTLATHEISIGDYVLSGGEISALVVVEAVSRLIAGVVGNTASIQTDSFHRGLLGFPQYTRPRSFRGMTVPNVLLSGDHRMIQRWRLKQAFRRTLQRRPELVQQVRLGPDESSLFEEAKAELDVERCHKGIVQKSFGK